MQFHARPRARLIEVINCIPKAPLSTRDSRGRPRYVSADFSPDIFANYRRSFRERSSHRGNARLHEGNSIMRCRNSS